jgi:hypothetical protein
MSGKSTCAAQHTPLCCSAHPPVLLSYRYLCCSIAPVLLSYTLYLHSLLVLSSSIDEEANSGMQRAIDLNAWHHAIHQVTGDMSIKFNEATIDDLKRWASALRAIADEMDHQGQPLSRPMMEFL